MYLPRRVVVVYFGLLATQFLLLLVIPRTTQCLKLETPKHHLPQMDRSGWQTVEVKPTASDRHFNQQEPPADDGETQSLSVSSRYKKLIEWDDDENNSSGNSLGSGSSLILPYVDTQQQEPQKKQSTFEASVDRLKPKWLKKSGKLVFHGRLKNSTSKTVDGVRLYINTHRPVAITRSEQHRVVGRNLMLMREQPEVVSQKDGDETPQHFGQLTIEPLTSTKRPTLTKKNKHLQDSLQNSLQLTTDPIASSYSKSFNSDWRPLMLTSSASNRKRHVAKIEVASSKHEADEGKTVFDSKWMPIAPTKRGDTKRDGLIASQQLRHKSTIEEPFDGENVLSEYVSALAQSTARESKSLLQKTNQDSRWTPVDTATTTTTTTTTTSLSETTELATTTSSPTVTSTSFPLLNHNNKLLTKHNSSESNQLRSASDLNYIYSSQPSGSPAATAIDWQSRVQPAASTGYYSTGYQQQQPVTSTLVEQPPIFPAGALVDTTSGQTPEVAMDSRSEPLPQQTDYSLPLTSASFQPAQPPPVRTSALPSTYGNGYDNSAYYYSAAPVAQQQRQVLAVPSPPSNQFVRQEHHYHYYNNQQRQQPQQPNHVVANNVIREIQPVVISQPIVQPNPTPSPQIIREIIKEVPMQTVQLQPIQVPRIIVPPPPPPSRELEPSYYPAQRIIRQISSSIPSVGVRQIRLPLPTIQLPVRLTSANAPAPVTRQTGSYIIPPVPQKTTTYLTETQAMPTHTTIMHTTQFTPATRTTVYTTDHQPPPTQPQPQTLAAATGYKRR